MAGRSRASARANGARADSQIPYPIEKRCCRCDQIKPAAQFPKARRERDGLKAYCKACAAVARHDWYLRNREREIQKTVQWQRANPQKRSALAKAVYWSNVDSRRERNRLSYRKHRSARLAAGRAAYAKRREKMLAQMAARYAAGPEPKREYARQWRARNPDKSRAIQYASYAKRKAAQGAHSPQQWDEVVRYFNGACAYCLTPTQVLAREHVVPLSAGGSDDIENIVPACRSCNSRKNARSLIGMLLMQAHRGDLAAR